MLYIADIWKIFRQLFCMMDIHSLLSWTISVRTKDNSNKILKWFLNLLKNINLLVTHQQSWISLIFWGNLTDLAFKRASRTLIIFYAESFKSLFDHANFCRAFARTIHNPFKVNNDNLMPITRLECAKHRNYSKLFHISLQRNTGSCGVNAFHGGYVIHFL